MKTHIYSLWVAGVMLVTLAGCQKDPLKNMAQEESRIYITDHDSTKSFKDYSTFSIADSVALIENGKSKKQLNEADAAYIAAVKKYMQTNGFMYVTQDQHPDLGINVNRIVNTNTGVISYGSYWNNYYDYWDPYYWGYPGYGYYLPYAYSVYQIKSGAISIDMLDLKNVSSDKAKLDVVWTGLIRGSGIYTADVADSQVHALFEQSPYLKNQ